MKYEMQKTSFEVMFSEFCISTVSMLCILDSRVTVIGGVNSESVMVENVGLAVVISLISLPFHGCNVLPVHSPPF